MKNTFLSCLSAAACLAVAAPSQSEKSEREVREVRVVRGQDPRGGVDIERRLAEVIELLDGDQLTTAQRDKARKSLQDLADRVRKQHARAEFRGKVEGKGEGKGGTFWRVDPADAEIDVQIVEVDGDPVILDVAPEVTVRTRVLRVEDMDADAHPEARARVVRKYLERSDADPVRVRGQAPRAPKPPKAPRAPKAPKAPGQVEWHEIESGGGAGGLFRLQREHGDEHVIEIAGADRDELRKLLTEKRLLEGRPRLLARVHEAHEADAHEAQVRLNDEHVMRVRKLIAEQRAAGDADEARGGLKVLLEKKRAAAGERRASTPKKRAQEVQLDDVTEEHDLHEMLDEMRAEMREIRSLMQKIRAQSKAGEAEGAGATGRLMRQ